MNHNIGNLEGIIPVLGGLGTLAMAYGKIAVKEKYKPLLEKHRKLVKGLSVLLIIFGLATLAGVF
ncbi:MAG: hypothetical protein ACAH83_14375 [Alphaproteobacteria bacterium]